MDYDVSEITASPRHTAVIAELTTWEAFPRRWPVLLEQVWVAVRSRPGTTPGRNVMLYRDDVPAVEVGVEVAQPFEPLGGVVAGTLPGGRLAVTTHRGTYDDLGRAHEAVLAWCERRALVRAGPRWEIYGHWNERSAEQEVEISYLLR